MDVQVNYLAVFLAMVAAMVVGFVWYSPAVFAKPWMRLARIDSMGGKQSDVWKPLLLTAIVCLITAYVLAHITYLSNQYFHHSYLQDALTTSFWAWLGLSAARFVTHDAFEGRPRALTAITLGNELVTLLAMGLVIGLLGV